jgi:hypothetical protein
VILGSIGLNAMGSGYHAGTGESEDLMPVYSGGDKVGTQSAVFEFNPGTDNYDTLNGPALGDDLVRVTALWATDGGDFIIAIVSWVTDFLYVYSGGSWSEISSLLPADFRFNFSGAVWGTSATNVFVGGSDAAGSNQVILKYNGATFSEVYRASGLSGNTVKSIHGTGPNNIYACGVGNFVVRSTDNGSSWNYIPVPGGSTFDMWNRVYAVSPTFVAIVGRHQNGQITPQYHDGVGWNALPGIFTGPSFDNILTALWGTSPTSLYAGGQGPNSFQPPGLWFYNGVIWTQVNYAIDGVVLTRGRFHDMAADDSGGIYLVSQTFTGDAQGMHSFDGGVSWKQSTWDANSRFLEAVTFTPDPDVDGPLVVPTDPTQDQVNVSVDSNVTLTVYDESGIDLSTLQVEIDRGEGGGFELAFDYDGVPQFKPGWDGVGSNVSDVAGTYTIVIDPTTDFELTTAVKTRVTAQDIFGNPARL